LDEMKNNNFASKISDEDLPEVTVIIRARNEESNIANCIRSVKKQTYPKDKLHILVVDNASTDRTAEIAKEEGAEVIYCDIVSRGAAARVGVQASRTALVAFLDADAEAPKDWLKKMVKKLLEYNSKNDKIIGVWCRVYDTKTRTAFEEAVSAILADPARLGFAATGVVFKKAIEECGNFDPSMPYYEEAELAARMRKMRGYLFQEVPGVFVHHKARSTVREYWKQHIDSGIGAALMAKRQGIRWVMPTVRRMGVAGLVVLATITVALGYILPTIFSIALILIGWMWFVFKKIRYYPKREKLSLKAKIWLFALFWIGIFGDSIGFLIGMIRRKTVTLKVKQRGCEHAIH